MLNMAQDNGGSGGHGGGNNGGNNGGNSGGNNNNNNGNGRSAASVVTAGSVVMFITLLASMFAWM